MVGSRWWPASLLVLVALGLAITTACGADEAPTAAPVDSAAEVSADEAPTAAPVDSAAEVSADEAPTAAPVDSAAEVPADECSVVADLEDDEELRRWQIVNDGVMGGRSSAQAELVDSAVIVTGEIVTQGGGFSSIRLALEEPLGEVTRLRFRIRTDGRAYQLTAADAAPGRDRRISHQGPIPATGFDQLGTTNSPRWEEVDVDLTDLETSIFGRAVEVDPFRPEDAVEIGIILADGEDGPFRFELDRIAACR